MSFTYSRHGLEKNQHRLERALEIVPGFLSWTILIGMIVLSFTKPLLATALIIAFILYWLLRMLHMNTLLLISYARFHIEKITDWMSRVRSVDRLFDNREITSPPDVKTSWREKLSLLFHRRHLDKLKQSGSVPPLSKDIYHLIIIPVAKEDPEIVEPGIAAVQSCSWPAERILLVIALEQRAPDNVKQQMHELREKYASDFFSFLVIEHPSDIPGQSRVKGANATYAAQHAARFLKEKNIPFENVIVSCFDADTVPVKDYFSCLAYYFMITPDRTHTSFQPVPVYFNNIWEVPSFARVIDVGTSFFQLVESTDPRRLVTFSSHSMSFKALVEIDYWPVDIISDDSAIYWKAYLHYEGQYMVVPMPITVSMDIITGRTNRETFVNIHKQKRRWAWGVENFPIVVRGFLHSKKISLYKKLYQSLRLMDKFTSWATWSFLLAFICWLPTFFAGKEFATTTVYYIAPRIRTVIFALASIGLLICFFTSTMLLPKEKREQSLSKKFTRLSEWALIPFVVIILSALPALDAQTRLMLGKYMEFWVTDKYRLKK